MKSLLPLSLCLTILVGCNLKDESPVTYTTYLIEPGDLVVTNSGNKTVILLDEAGKYKATLLDLAQAETPTAIAFNTDTKELLVTVDSTADRVIGISAFNGTRADFINDIGNLTGILYGMTKLTQGDYLISEGNTIERYSATGVRVTTGAWPKTLMNTTTNLKALADGNFLACSTNVDLARIYNNAGTQVTTSTASGIASTTDLFSCIPLASGNFALAWNGTTDTIQIRGANLTTVVASYANATILTNPKGMAQKENGNILIVDQTANHIVEITEAGALVGTYGDAVNSPIDIFIVPDFYD